MKSDEQYPSMPQVEITGLLQLLGWQLFLPSPRSEREVEILNVILQRVATIREAEPDAYVTAHKELTR